MLPAWLFLFAPLTFYGQTVNVHTYQPGLFKNIKNTADARRVEAARNICRVYCRDMAEPDAMKSLDDLKQLSVELNDQKLECAVYDMRADYYSVNKGYNVKSNAYFYDAIAFAKEERMTLETGIYEHRKANYFFLYKKNAEACRYYLLSEEILKEVGFANVPDIAKIFLETGNFYYSVGDFDNARDKLRAALQYSSANYRTRINIINTLGLTYRNNGQIPHCD